MLNGATALVELSESKQVFTLKTDSFFIEITVCGKLEGVLIKYYSIERYCIKR